jgi:hypothetical protein
MGTCTLYWLFEFALTLHHSDNFYTITFKNNLEVMEEAIRMHHEYLETIKAADIAGNWTIQTMFQPIPSFFSEHSVEKGGNMLGLERFDDNLIRKSLPPEVPTRDTPTY